MSEGDLDKRLTFIHFDQSHSGVHDGETRRRVRSGAARASHSSGERKPKASKKKGIPPRPSAGPSNRRRPSSQSITPTSSTNVTPTTERGSPGLRECESAGSGEFPNWEAIVGEQELQRQQQQPPPPPPRSARPTGSRASSAIQIKKESSSSSLEDDEASKTFIILALNRQPDPTNPFDSWPVPMKPFYPQLLQYLWPFILRGWRALNTTTFEQAGGLQWVQNLVMNDAAYFYKNMHSAAADLMHRNLLSIEIYRWLQTQCIAAIQEAVADEQRRRTPGVIFAVWRIALMEITLGDRDVGQRIHRPAAVKMIQLAGGPSALGLPAIIKKHVYWAERLMARQTGVVMFEEAFTADASGDLGVLDAYLPHRPRGQGRI